MKDLKIFNIDVKIIRGRETMQRRSNITGGEGGGIHHSPPTKVKELNQNKTTQYLAVAYVNAGTWKPSYA